MEAITRERFNQLYGTHINFMTGNFVEYDPIQHGNFGGLKFEDFVLDGLNISNANFKNTTFENCSMRCATFKDCHFDGCTFKNVNAECTIFDNSSFKHATFVGSNEFFGTSFYNCSFEGTNIKSTRFTNSSFRGAEIVSCRFDECSFVEACFDEIRFDISDRNLGRTVFKKSSLDDSSMENVENVGHVAFISCSFDNTGHLMGIRGLKYLNKKLYYKVMWRRIINRLLHSKKNHDVFKKIVESANESKEELLIRGGMIERD